MEKDRLGATLPYALVVDDNAVILLHAVDLFEDAGLSVFAAGDSERALNWLHQHANELALLFVNVETSSDCIDRDGSAWDVGLR